MQHAPYFLSSTTRRHRAFLSSHHAGQALLIHDGGHHTFGDEDLRGYFKDAYRVFLDDLTRFQNIETPLTKDEEERLISMLDDLIQAKKVWHEECRGPIADAL